MLLVSRTCNLDESCELAGFIKKCNRGLPFQPFRSPFDLFFFKRSFILEIVILRGKLFWSRFFELCLILESWITMEWILCQLKASSFSFKLPRVWAVKIVATDLTVVLLVHAGLARFRQKTCLSVWHSRFYVLLQIRRNVSDVSQVKTPHLLAAPPANYLRCCEEILTIKLWHIPAHRCTAYTAQRTSWFFVERLMHMYHVKMYT
jgi:hypothetical protein